jgi:hypothetical protein
MKFLKVSLLKRKIISVFLSLLLICSCVLFSSCVPDDLENGGEEREFFAEYIDSFKVVYSNSLVNDQSVVEPLTDTFFLNSLGVINDQGQETEVKGLSYFYGSANAGAVDKPNWFPDSIRMMVIKDVNGNAVVQPGGKIWKWTFNQNLIGNFVNNLKPRIETVPADITYDGWKNRLWNGDLDNNEKFDLNAGDGISYSSTFSNMYLLPLKIVMYEILLGYETLTTFEPATIANLRANGYSLTVSEAQEGLVARVVSSGETSIVGDVLANESGAATVEESLLKSSDLVSYITKLKNEFLKKTKYIGFTKENSDRMISYILNEVIGKDLVVYDYMTFGPSASNTTYIQSVSKTKDGFKAILGLATGSGTDSVFNQYVSGLKKGDVIYNPIGYNYLVYDGAVGTGAGITYSFKEYYNYRNYIDRVAEIIYNQTYDTSYDFKFSYDIVYNSVKLTTITYDFVKVNTALDGTPIEEGTLARRPSSATAATFLQHFGGETFFEELSDDEPITGYNFKNSPKAEYQSITIITKASKSFEVESGFLFNILAYDRNLEINMKVRYYHYDTNAQTGTLYVFDVDPTSFSDARQVYDPIAQKNGFETDFYVGFDADTIPNSAKGTAGDFGFETFKVPHVTNSEYADFGKEGEVNLGKEENRAVSDYYKVENSQNGYGGITVINEKEMKCSFYEIIFDIVKSPDDPVNMDYDFKITLSSIM